MTIFDRKLLEYLHEQGVHFMLDRAGLRMAVQVRR